MLLPTSVGNPRPIPFPPQLFAPCSEKGVVFVFDATRAFLVPFPYFITPDTPRTTEASYGVVRGDAMIEIQVAREVEV